jgi:hypothetical protein
MTYDPTSPGALSYLEAARELASRSSGPAAATTTTQAQAPKAEAVNADALQVEPHGARRRAESVEQPTPVAATQDVPTDRSEEGL